MANMEARVARLERRDTHNARRTLGRDLFADDLLEILEEAGFDIIDQGVEFNHEGPLGGRSVTIPVLYVDEIERQHQIMITVYGDSRIDETFARNGWTVEAD